MSDHPLRDQALLWFIDLDQCATARRNLADAIDFGRSIATRDADRVTSWAYPTVMPDRRAAAAPRTSIADEMREEHRRRVLANDFESVWSRIDFSRAKLNGRPFSECGAHQGGRDAKICAHIHDSCGYPRLWRYCCECPSSRCPESRHPTGPATQLKAEDSDQDGFFRYHRGMMGGGLIGRGYRHHDWGQSRSTIGPMMMRIIFSLMDADGDGKLTLQEFQAAHERIFKAMDTDHDGTVTLEEMEAFMRGTTRPASQQ